VAYTQHEYALMLLARRQAGDVAKASVLLEQALVIAQACGMDRLQQAVLAVTAKLRSPLTGTRAPTATPVMSEQVKSVRDEGLAPQYAENVFRPDGAYWTLAYHGTTCRLNDAKGLHYIACLLRHPGRAFLTTELFATMNGVSNSDSFLNAPEQAAYKRRLDELQNELAEAHGMLTMRNALAKLRRKWNT
jgi:hypothetical protein